MTRRCASLPPALSASTPAARGQAHTIATSRAKALPAAWPRILKPPLMLPISAVPQKTDQTYRQLQGAAKGSALPLFTPSRRTTRAAPPGPPAGQPSPVGTLPARARHGFRARKILPTKSRGLRLKSQPPLDFAMRPPENLGKAPSSLPPVVTAADSDPHARPLRKDPGSCRAQRLRRGWYALVVRDTPATNQCYSNLGGTADLDACARACAAFVQAQRTTSPRKSSLASYAPAWPPRGSTLPGIRSVASGSRRGCTHTHS